MFFKKNFDAIQTSRDFAIHSKNMVPETRLELVHLAVLDPKSSASTNSAIRA